IDDLLAAVHDDNRIATLECNPVIVHERGSRRGHHRRHLDLSDSEFADGGARMTLTQSVKFVPGLAIPMRDGVTLRADIYRPDDDEPRPVVLARTPYDKQLADPPRPWLRFASEGYIVVVQDCRGRWESQGEFEPFRDEM